MAVGLLVTTAGEGAWYASWAIYFTTIAGLSAPVVGLGLLIAGGVGLLAAVPVGALADRLGPRNVLAALVAVSGLSMASYLAVRSFWLFLLVSIVNTVADRASAGVKTAYVAGLASASQRVPELARQRVASHLGYTLGAAGGAICLAIGTTTAFAVLIGLNAATSLFYALIVARLPVVQAQPRQRVPPRGTVLTDWTFLAVMAFTAVLSLCWGLVSTGLPLWLVRSTHIPVTLAAVVIIINSAGIATLQVVASRGCDTPARAARRALVSGIALAGACVLLALTQDGSGVVAILVVLAGAGAHLVGELLFIAAKWGLTLGLTPAGSTGAYQGMAAATQAAAQMFSPVLMTLLVVSWGQPGWFVLAGLFLTAGAAVVPVTRYAATRHRVECPPGRFARGSVGTPAVNESDLRGGA
jgi:MFS family permease